MADILALMIFGTACAAVPALLLGLSVFVGPRPRRTPEKMEPYECGFPQAQDPGREVPVKFHLIAILFVIFDVEFLILLPWAAVYRGLAPGERAMAFGLGTVFLAYLVLGLLYAWRKGALDWQ